ncbi:small, acid-soluble spore protein, H family [Bacillus sp. WLY-B-L8]|uniref:small, acid-soluble spore protein, H family n=1 Tax=Bacillus multifaciens TaxID=3068506 RepID=UPI003531CBAF
MQKRLSLHQLWLMVQIYIQNVDENIETTRIYPLNELNNEQEIPLSSLIEY